MERNGEARKWNLGSSNGLPRRCQRSNNLRDSADGVMEMQETVRLRERASKRERDRDLLNRSKRRRADKVVLQGSNNKGGEESTEESSGEEKGYEIEQLSNCKISPSARVSRQVPPLKATDEIISFLVPRKARSASVKRSHESWVVGNGGFMEEQNDRRASISLARRSAESDRVSRSSSNGPVRKKMRTNGPKTRLPKSKKSSNKVQEDIEIEIAEVLYGLMKQSQSSKREDSAGNPLPKLKSEDVNGFSTDTKPSVSPQIASSAQSQSQTTVLPDTLVGLASKAKVEAEDSPTPVKVEIEQWERMELCSPKKGQISGLNALISDFNLDQDAFKTASVLMESRENEVMIKHVDTKPSVEEEPNSVDGAVTREKSVSTEKESTKLDVDFQDSTLIKAISKVSKVENEREEKLKIDLMAPPPLASSPERDSVDTKMDPKHKVLDTELKIETLAMNEAKVLKKEMKAEGSKESKDKKMDTIREKRDSLNLDWEKPREDSGSDCCKFEHGQKQPSKAGIPKVEKTAQSSSMPVPINLAGWPNCLPPLGYMPPFPTMVPMDGSIGSSTALQPPHFVLSQPRPKRCSLHHYIARNIHIHQQFTKMNHFWPAVPGSSLCGAMLNNRHGSPSAENSIPGNTLQESVPVVNLNPTDEKGKVAASFPGITRKDKNSDCANFVDTAQRKQVVVQQASQPAPVGNLMHSPAVIFPLSQHQKTANQSGPSNSAASTNKASLINNSTPGISTSSTALHGVAAAVSFNYPKLGANEAPYLTILQNNGYPFAIAAPVGNPAIRGGTPTQALPFFNGSFYSTPMFHHQLQQQAHSQHPIQPAHQNAVKSSGSSSSNKQSESQQPQGAQVSGNNFSSSASMLSRQLQKCHALPSNQSCNMEPEMYGENTTANAQKGVYGQNTTLPHQPLNYALLPSATLGGGSVNENHSEKQLSQQKNLMGGVDFVPPQAFAMSFASLTGNNIASNLSFSSMAQNPTIIHSLPDMVRQGYQVAPVPQAALKKNHQISDGKNGAGSTSLDDGKKVSSGKSRTTNGQTYVFENSTGPANFVSSPFTGNWPPRSINSTAISISTPIGANLSNSQQQLLQPQKQHMVRQHQQQPAATSRGKTQTTNNIPVSSIRSKFSSNAAIFPQTVPQSTTAAQSTSWKNPARTPASPATNVSGVKKFPRQSSSRSPPGQTQISFGVSIKSGLTQQGQEIPTSSQSLSPMIVGSQPSGGNWRTSSTGNKVGSSVPTLQPQQSEVPSAGNGQKYSPVCGRNMPSILSTCPSHLSELKY